MLQFGRSPVCRSARITDSLVTFHWLLASERIQFKLAVIVYRALHGTAPPYLSDLIVLTSVRPASSLSATAHFLLPAPRCGTVCQMTSHLPRRCQCFVVNWRHTCFSDHTRTLLLRFISWPKSKSNPWFTSTLRAFKSTVGRAENIWKHTHSALDWSSFKSVRNRYHNLILAS